MKNNDFLKVLRNIDNNPSKSQRELAKNLGFSLGKFNYILNALKKKGLIKFANFKKKSQKIKLCLLSHTKRFYRKDKINNKIFE